MFIHVIIHITSRHCHTTRCHIWSRGRRAAGERPAWRACAAACAASAAVASSPPPSACSTSSSRSSWRASRSSASSTTPTRRTYAASASCTSAIHKIHRTCSSGIATIWTTPRCDLVSSFVSLLSTHALVLVLSSLSVAFCCCYFKGNWRESWRRLGHADRSHAAPVAHPPRVVRHSVSAHTCAHPEVHHGRAARSLWQPHRDSGHWRIVNTTLLVDEIISNQRSIFANDCALNTKCERIEWRRVGGGGDV